MEKQYIRTYTANKVSNSYEEVTSGIGPITVVEYIEDGVTYRIICDMFDAKGSFRSATNIQRLQVKVGTGENAKWLDSKFNNSLEYISSTANDYTYVDSTTGVIDPQPYKVVLENVLDGEGNPTGETIEVVTTELKDNVITEFQFLTNFIYPSVHTILEAAIKRKHNII